MEPDAALVGHWCAGSGMLSAVSAFGELGALRAVSSVACHEGVMARGPA